MDKNVYLVSFEYFPISNGGLARYAKEIIDRLLVNKNSHKAIIAVPKDNKLKFHKGVITIPCKFYSNKYLSYLEFSWKLYSSFKKDFKKDRFVFFSSFSYLFNPILPKKYYLFITNTTKRVFITDYPEETWFERFKRKVIYYFLFHWEKYMSRKATKIFAISNSTKVDVTNQYGINEDKIIVIPCALNKTTFRLSKPKILFNKKLLFVGRLVPRKNIHDLIKITKLLVNTDKEYILNIVGEGDCAYVEKIKKEIKKNNLQNNIIFHGKVTDAELNRQYKSNSIFVFTSLVEGFGLVLLEAMSKGLPVVAYDVNGVRDVIINRVNGYSVKSFDYQGFSHGILSLNKNNHIYQQMSRNALKRVNDFNWDQSVKDLVIELEKTQSK